MVVTTNRIIQLNITSDPTSALLGSTLSIYNDMLFQASNVQMNAGVTGTATVMQANDTVDLDNNGTFESVYQTRYNYSNSTYTLSDGSTITGQVNLIKITTGGVPKYYLIIADALAPQLDALNITSITLGGSMATSPNTDGNNFNAATTYILTCYAAQTHILTERGERRVETLMVGDKIWVQDRGFVPLKWIGRRTVVGQGAFAPIVFEKGAIGNERRLRVSPQHRMVVQGADVELMFGTPAALVAAQHLAGTPGVTQQPCGEITYIHLMFDRHCIISAEGVLSESYFPGEYSLHGQEPAVQAELLALFPELRSLRQNYSQTCLPCLNAKEAKLVSSHTKDIPRHEKQAVAA